MVKTMGTGSGAGDLTRLVPGFDFLQGLMKAGGAGLPGIGQWIAPTLDPAELQKRIDELRTVQFWLEQNARLLGTTIQALEVQRMTLATLHGMNLPMADLADALKVGSMQLGPAEAARAGTAPKVASALSSTGTASSTAGSSRAQPKAAAGGNGRGSGSAAVDPMQWWGSLTQQFTELAAKAMKEGSAEMARMNAARDAAGASPSPSSGAPTSPGKSAASSGSGASGGSGTPAAAAPKQPTLAEAAATSIERAMAASTQFAGAAAKASAALAGVAMPAATKPSPKSASSAPKSSSASSPPAPSKTATALRRRARKNA